MVVQRERRDFDMRRENEDKGWGFEALGLLWIEMEEKEKEV